jgi:hypothetical protein
MNDLVQRLSEGRHPVEVSLRPERTVQAFKECVDRDFVLVRFTSTRGTTELGVPLDRQRSRFDEADFAEGTGHVTIVGELMLDFVPVRCVAEIELPALTGHGRLEPLVQSVADAS